MWLNGLFANSQFFCLNFGIIQYRNVYLWILQLGSIGAVNLFYDESKSFLSVFFDIVTIGCL